MIQQIIVNGAISGSVILLIAIGFGIIFRSARFFHFAHGAVLVVAPYAAFQTMKWVALPLVLVLPVAIMTATALGTGIEVFVYRPLRHRKAGSPILLIASLGIYIVIQNVVSLCFGDDTKSIRTRIVSPGYDLYGARITGIQFITICVAIIITVGILILMKQTKLGIAFRAVANDPKLARTAGIETDSVILWSFVLGSAFASVGGVLMAMDTDMTPTMGMRALMMGVVAVIIGDVNSFIGIALGSVFLGMALHLGVWKIGTQWQDSIAFLILLIFLLFRPQGFLGKKIKKATV